MEGKEKPILVIRISTIRGRGEGIHIHITIGVIRWSEGQE